MAKKILIYIAGVVTGALLVILFAVLFASNNSANDGITLFEQEGDCVSGNSFKVFQVLETGDALANEIERGFLATGVTVLFLNDGKTSYYDDQVIKIPSGKCATQIGVFKYESRSGVEKTVPVVEIRDK